MCPRGASSLTWKPPRAEQCLRSAHCRYLVNGSHRSASLFDIEALRRDVLLWLCLHFSDPGVGRAGKMDSVWMRQLSCHSLVGIRRSVCSSREDASAFSAFSVEQITTAPGPVGRASGETPVLFQQALQAQK